MENKTTEIEDVLHNLLDLKFEGMAEEISRLRAITPRSQKGLHDAITIRLDQMEVELHRYWKDLHEQTTR
jgi:hypothetical protein